MKGRLAVALGLAAVVGAARQPAAHAGPNAVAGRVSKRGFDFIAAQVPKYLPSGLDLTDLKKGLYNCPFISDDPSMSMRDGRVDLHLDDFQINPSTGELSVFIQLDIDASASVDLHRPYACFGDSTCNIDASAHDFMLTATFAPRQVSGQLDLDVVSIDIGLDADMLEVDSSGCVVGDFAEFFIDHLKGWIIGQATPRLEKMAREQIQPQLTAALRGMLARSGSLLGFDYAVEVADLKVDQGGVTALIDGDVSYGGPPAECIPALPERAASGPGSPLMADHDDHVGLAVAIDLLNDALDAAWRSGLLCITRQVIADRFELNPAYFQLIPLLLQLPLGSDVDLDVHLNAPPQLAIVGPGEEGGQAQVVLDGVSIAVLIAYPDGTSGRLEIAADLDITAKLGIDPAANAFALELEEIHPRRMELIGSQGPILRLDPVRLEQLMRDLALPMIADRLAGLPLSAAALQPAPGGPLDGAFVVVNDLKLQQGYAYAFADLFLRPDFDGLEPTTSLAGVPPPLTHPGITRFVADGEDDQTPGQLLRFRFRLDGGDWTAPSFSRVIWAPATGGEHTVEVLAVDLNGNQDSTPVAHTYEVDAEAPTITLLSVPAEIERTRRVEVAFVGKDDRTPSDRLSYRWRLLRVDTTSGQTELVSEQDFLAGLSRVDIEVPADGLYKAELTVEDEAGNLTSAETKFAVVEDTGCAAAGGRSGGGPALVLLLLAAAAIVPRRRGRSGR